MIELNSKFYEEIEKIVEKYGASYLDAVTHYAEQNGVEIEQLSPVINRHPKLKAMIQLEAEDLNYLPKSSRLPI